MLGVSSACAYAGLTGFGIPALRASTQALAGTLAVIGGRPGPAWNGLLLAGLIVLAFYPGSLFAPELALSFVAVCGILIWAPSGRALAARLGSSVAAGLVLYEVFRQRHAS